jgi:hypothetical protein
MNALCLMRGGTIGLVAIIGVALLAFGEPSPQPENDIKATPAEPVSLWIEAESFPGLVHHPNWNTAPGQGWYAKDHRHASGRAFIVCDEQSQGAKATKKLARTLPAGEYLVTPTLVLMRFSPGREGGYGQDNGNRLLVELGMADQAGEFKPLAAKEFINLFGSGYADHEDYEFETFKDGSGKERSRMKRKFPILSVKDGWNAIRLTASRVAAAGIGDLPEHPLATLCVDKIGLTNMPGTKVRLSHSGRCWYTLPQVSGTETGAAAKTPEAQKKPAAEAPKPPLPAPAGNLISNGSFEAGVRPQWGPTMTGSLGNRFDDEDTVEDKSAPHGKRVAVLTPFFFDALPLQTDQELEIFEKTPEKSKLSLVQSISHAPFPVNPGRHRLTVWARASRPDLALTVGKEPTATFKLTDKWAAYQADVVFPEVKEGEPLSKKGLELSFTTKNRDDRVFLDAVSLQKVDENDKAETGPAAQPLPYKAGNGVEVSVCTRQYLATYYNSGPVILHATATNTTDKAANLTVDWKLYDVTGLKWDEGTAAITAPPGESVTVPIRLKESHLGSYGLSYRVRELETQRPAVTCFSVVQDPKSVKGKKPFIGAYAMSVEAEARALAYYGWDWKTDLNDRYQRGGYGSSKDEKTGEIKWQTYHRLNEIWGKHGIEWVGEIIPSEKPAYDPGVEGTKAAAHSYAKWYSHDVWAMVVGKVVAEYKGMCKYWILADEMEYGHHEQDSAAYCAIGSAAARKADPNVKVLFSVAHRGFENISSMLGSANWTDVLAGSYFGMGKWTYRRHLHIMQKHNIPTWHIGVGSGGPQEEESFDDYGLPSAQAAYLPRKLTWWAFDFSTQTAITEPDRYCPYTVKYAGMWTDPYNHFGPDGRLKTNGVIYTITCQNLRDARRGDLLVLEKASGIAACTFTKPDGTWVALNLLPPAFETRITLPLPATGVEALDYYLRALPVGKDAAGNAVLTLKRDNMVYLRGKPELVEAVRNMTAVNSLDIRHILVKTPAGYDYVCVLKNNTSRELSGSISAPKGLADPAGPAEQEFALSAGKEGVVRFPVSPDFAAARPLAHYPVQAQISVAQATLSEERDIREDEKFQKEGLVFDFGAEVWTHYAQPVTPERPIVLDGKTDEFRTSQVGAWTYITWEMGGSYEQSQGRRDADRCDDTQDLRLTTWVRYDSDNLYIAGEMLDDRTVFGLDALDKAKPGDRVVCTIDTDLLKDPLASGISSKHVQVVIGPEIVYHRAAVLREGKVIDRLPLKFQLNPGFWSFEIRLPVKALGLEALKAGQTLGFEIEVLDSDSDDCALQTEAAWAGAPYVSGDPRGHGQLLLH